MRTLIVEDDFASRKLAQKMLAPYGACDVAVDGREALRAFQSAHAEGEPYDLILLDIMLPFMDGREFLKAVRAWEEQKAIYGLDGVKVIMTTALGDHKSIMQAFNSQCEGYIVKPLSKDKVTKQLAELGLVPGAAA